MEYSENSSGHQAGMSSTSDEDDDVQADSATARRSKRLQYVYGDFAEILEGDILAVKPCELVFSNFIITFPM